MVSEGDLREFRDGQWITRYSAPASEKLVGAVPTGQRVVVISEGSLREFDGSAKTWKNILAGPRSKIAPFRNVATVTPQELWITGSHGLGRLRIARDGGPYEWTEIVGDAAGFSDFDFPEPGAPGELFAQAVSHRNGRETIVRWHNDALESVYDSTDDELRGWRGPDGYVWIVEGASMFRLIGGRKYPVDRSGILAGNIWDVFAGGDRTFWIATSEGIARYTPPLWRVPAGLEDLGITVHSVAEEPDGRLWFAATDWLLEFDGASWQRHRLPAGLQTHTVQTSSVVLLPHERLLVKASRAGKSETALIFDRKSGRFSELSHPSARRISMVSPRLGGGAWVVTDIPDTPGFRLDEYDGSAFRTVLEVGAEWKGADLRSILEQANGDLWLAGSAGGAIYSHGRLMNPFVTAAGYTDSGVFALAALPSGEIIAGGRDKVLKYNGTSWTLLRAGLDRIRTFTMARDGALWVASASGIHRFKDGSWISHQTEEGLPSVTSYLVFKDKSGRLWAGTTRGLLLYDPQADTDPPHTILDRSLNSPRDVSPYIVKPFVAINVRVQIEIALYKSQVDRKLRESEGGPCPTETTLAKLLQSVSEVANRFSIGPAAQTCLERICRHTGWAVGHFFLLGTYPLDNPIPQGLWHVEGAGRFAALLEASEPTESLEGTSLPGSLASSGEPNVIILADYQPKSERARAAANAGLQTAFVFPVKVAGEIIGGPGVLLASDGSA